MYNYYLLYDVKFTTYDTESDTENEIPLNEIKALIPDINRNISNYFDFDFHTGLIERDVENIAWAFPYVDVFEGKVYFVVEMGVYTLARLSVDEVTRLSESFSERDGWKQHFSVEYQGLPVYVNVDWESRNDLSFTYIRSVHCKLYEFMNSYPKTMTEDGRRLIRAYFYKLREKYPEIEVMKSVLIYDVVSKNRSFKLTGLFNAAYIDGDEGWENYSEQESCLYVFAQTYETYKNLKHWSSKEQLDSLKDNVKKIAENTAAEESQAVIQRFEDVEKAVFALGEQLQDFMRKTSPALNFPDKLQDCLNEFLYA